MELEKRELIKKIGMIEDINVIKQLNQAFEDPHQQFAMDLDMSRIDAKSIFTDYEDREKELKQL